MAQQDLKNNQSIRKVLVRHWVDLGRLNVLSAAGRVTIRGTLQLLRGVKHEMDSQLVENIFREIHHINEIKWVNVELDNWVFIEGAWHKRETSKTDAQNFNENSATGFEI
jgi:hypothetical protein